MMQMYTLLLQIFRKENRAFMMVVILDKVAFLKLQQALRSLQRSEIGNGTY